MLHFAVLYLICSISRLADSLGFDSSKLGALRIQEYMPLQNRISDHMSILRDANNIATLVRCARLCLETDSCGSLFYHNDTGYCRLFPFSAIHETDLIRPNYGSRYYRRAEYTPKEVCEKIHRYIYSMVTESCVHLYDTNFANNADARAFCQRKGAELARIRDYDDLNFIASVIGNGYVKNYFIQGIKDDQGTWWLDNGEMLTHFEWSPGRTGANGNYLALNAFNGKMVDVSGTDLMGYVCQILL